MPSTELRRARVATTAVFFATGAVYAAWATRVPAVQDRLDLSPGALGVAVLGLEGGALAGLPAGGAVVARLGSTTGLRLGFAVFPAALVAVALAPGLAALAFALAAMAAATSVVDVAMNAQGVELERRYGRPILSSLHAGHPLGLVAGGIAGTAAAAAGVDVRAHFALAAAGGLVAGMAATAWTVREAATAAGAGLARPSRRLLLLGLLAFCAFLLDAVGYNWSAVHLRTDGGAGAGVAAAGFTGFALALAAGRLAGDAILARAGRTRLIQGCGLVAAAGGALVVAAPGSLALAGWAAVGLGVGPLAPMLLGAAARERDVAAPVAIAAVTTVGYAGSLAGPPAVGALAELAGLSTALALLVAVALCASALARPCLGRRTASSRAPCVYDAAA